MGLFSRKPKIVRKSYDRSKEKPVLRCSICTGEQVACMRDRHSGKLQEIMLIRSPADLEAFCRRYGADPAQIKKVY